MDKKSSYNFSADLLRVLAIAGVVSIHISYAVYARPDFFGGISWWISLAINSFSRVAIPLFIMISGYFLLNKKESYHDTVKRTFHRIFIPLLFWFLAQLIWNNGYISLKQVNWNIISRLLTVSVFDLYFLVILVGLYLISPILREFLHHTSDKTQKIFTFAALIFGVLLFFTQYIFSECAHVDIFTYWIPYTGLFVAGYFLGNNLDKVKHVFTYGTLYVIGLGITIGMGALYYYLHWHGNNILDPHSCLSYYSDWYLSPNVIIMSVALFVLVMRMKFRVSPLIHRAVFSVARASFGIYLLHTFFIDILYIHFRIFDHAGPGWLHVILKWITVFVLSYLSTILLTKIPILKRTFGEIK